MKKKIKNEKKFVFFNHFKKFILSFAIFLTVIFLGLNIYFSQNINLLFLKITSYHYPSIVEFLKKIKNTSYFSNELSNFKKIYGQKLVDDVLLEEKQRQEQIKKYEGLLKINPASRDLLYRLYILYKESGDEKKAHQYLKKAKEIDPWIEE